MKRAVYWIALMALLFTVGGTAAAEELNTYYLEVVDMEISIPADFITLNQQSPL